MKIVKASAAFTQPINGKAIMRALEEAREELKVVFEDIEV